MKAIVYVLLFGLYCSRIQANSVEAYEWRVELNRTTADRIKDHEYPVEVHYVETEDSYVIQMFRIPYSHKLQNQNQYRPAVILQHGMTSSSDAWILNGPNDALAYLFADAGYDVWMGNARGNRYSRNNTRLSTKHPHFWQFTWHEIGSLDMSAMIDHILETTHQESLHYVGHSQGTTAFFVLMSTKPEYNEKIKTAHLLAPVAFMSHMKTPWAKYTKRFLSKPNKLTKVIDTQEVVASTMWYIDLYEHLCKFHFITDFMCTNLYYFINGDSDGGQTNQTVADHLNETHPAGISTSQVLHYMQEYESGHFRQFDHGLKDNLKIYGRETPPDYEISNIRNENLYFYYSDSDVLADVSDVEYLASVLPNYPNMFHVPDPTFSHGDFATSYQVKSMINDRVIAAANLYEQILSNKNNL